MGNFPPSHCPYCGTELAAVEPPTAYHCPDCDDYRFYNPTPSARVAVVDDDSILLVTRPYDDCWIVPGGKLEVRTQPAAHAARELREETNLTVDPDDLELFHHATGEVQVGEHVLSLVFAARRAAVTGDLVAGSDAGDARFWTPEELAASGEPFREMADDPVPDDDLGDWIRRANAALE